MVKIPTALVVVGAVVIILGTWMMINEITSGLRTLIAGVIIEIIALLMILFRNIDRKKSG